MHLIGFIILGAIAGFIAHKIMGEGGQGFIMNTVIGVIGAAMGGEIMGFLGKGGVDGFNLYSILVAVGGSVGLLAVVQALKQMKGSA